jgi:hypothetical protein
MPDPDEWSVSHVVPNTGMSSFADVMAQFFLGQRKHMSIKKHGAEEDIKEIDMTGAMRMCGLSSQFALLRAWSLVWGGVFDDACGFSSHPIPKRSSMHYPLVILSGVSCLG